MKNKIRELRLKRGLTLKELAEETGYVFTQISKMELEQRNLTDNDINILCNYFKVSADYLLCRSDKKLPDMDIISQLTLRQRFLIDTCDGLTEDQYKELIKYIEYMKIHSFITKTEQEAKSDE